jgi:hypothetical protein
VSLENISFPDLAFSYMAIEIVIAFHIYSLLSISIILSSALNPKFFNECFALNFLNA